MTYFLDKTLCRVYSFLMKSTPSVNSADMNKAVSDIRAVRMTDSEKSTIMARISAVTADKPIAPASPLQPILVVA